MSLLKKIMFLGASAFCLTAMAEETMIYDLRDQSNFDINRQFSVDKDEEPWMWARYNVNGQDVSAPEQYNSSYTDGYYSSAYYTPDLSLSAGTYKIYTKPRKKNSDYTTSRPADLHILLGQGEMSESAYNKGAMTEIGNITDIKYSSTYSGTDYENLPVREIEFTITTPGQYKIAFFNKGASVTLHETYIVRSGEGGTVTPDPGTDPEDPEVDPDDPNTDPDDPTVDPDDPDEPDNPDVNLEVMDLPFSDSFAGAKLDGSKWEVITSGGKGEWNAMSVVLPGQFLGDWMSVDDDGGMAVYDGWNSSAGDWARLVTAPLTKSSSSAPVVDFWFRHSHSRGCKNYIKIQVSADGGDWQDVADSQIQTYIESMDDGGWAYYKFAIDPYIAGCETYRVSFTGYTDGISTYLPIDNVNIYNMADKDVRVLAVEVPEVAVAGKDLEISVTLENMGGTTLAADAYTLGAESDFPGKVTFENVAIPSLESVVVKGKAKLTAEEVLDGPEYSFVISLNVPGNAGQETIVSEEKPVKAVFVDYKAPQSAMAAEVEDGALNISWESVKDLDHQAINFNENFNDLPAREQIEVDGEKVWQDGAKGNFNGFVSIDLDKQDGGSYYSTSGSEFMVFKDFMTGSMPQGHSGQYIGLTLPANYQQDDWLITPELNAAESSLISLQARIAYIHRESDSYNNSIEVLYSTEDYNKNNPSASFKKSIYSNTSKATSGDLPHDGLYHWLRLNEIPAEAKYVALHFITKSAMQSGVWIDRIWVSETDQQPLEGYYVYRRGEGRLNAAPLAKDQLTYLVGDGSQNSGSYYVTALYTDGESQPCEVTVGENTSVESPAVSSIGIAAVAGGVVITGADGMTSYVYAPDGKSVASASCSASTLIPLNSGLYIVKAGNRIAKIIVR